MDNTIPTDSVLRRHYETTRNKTSPNKPSQSDGGFMGWLKRIFGS